MRGPPSLWPEGMDPSGLRPGHIGAKIEAYHLQFSLAQRCCALMDAGPKSRLFPGFGFWFPVSLF